MSKVITPGKAIDTFMKNLDAAFDNKMIRKPIAKALYETWKWAAQNEMERYIEDGENV